MHELYTLKTLCKGNYIRTLGSHFCVCMRSWSSKHFALSILGFHMLLFSIGYITDLISMCL